MNEQNILDAIKQLNNECYGLQIKQQLELTLGKYISIGKLYRMFDELERKGLVSSHEGEATHERGLRKKKYFKLKAHLLT